jgi:uncharacterized protein (UPF0147 family)
MTLAFKLAKYGSIIAIIETLFEGIVFGVNEDKCIACKNAIKKISPFGDVKITPDNLPDECKGDWFFRVAWDFATTSEGLYRNDYNFWRESFENFADEWSMKFKTILPFSPILTPIWNIIELGWEENRIELKEKLLKQKNKFQNSVVELENKAYQNITESESIAELENFINDDTNPKELRDAVKERLNELKNKVTNQSDESRNKISIDKFFELVPCYEKVFDKTFGDKGIELVGNKIKVKYTKSTKLYDAEYFPVENKIYWIKDGKKSGVLSC